MMIRRSLVLVLACGLAASAHAEDCNNNGIDDATDIYVDCTSLDLDDNGVPDECDIASGAMVDCNGNGIADWADIFGASNMCDQPVGGGSADCDNNGVPDECQSDQDCNANGIPDACDIRDNTESDADGNGIPDSCDILAGAADCNGNGVPDAADVRTSLGFAATSYIFAASPTVPAFPIDLAVGDVDGDGDLDIVAANRAFPSGESVGVFRNNGSGGFTLGTIYNSGGAAESLALSDLDGDGDLDIALAQRNGSTFPVVTMINSGAGVFTLGGTFAAGQVPISVAAGDIDGDGDNDLAVADINGNRVSILTNNGSGGFSAPFYIPVGSRPLDVKLADLDNDGDLDMAVCVQTSAEVVVFTNTAGAFAESDRIPMGGLYAATALAIDDFDADGLKDIAVALQYSFSNGILLNQGGNTFSNPVPYTGHAGNPVAITSGDFDGDGVVDLATTLSPPWPDGPLSINRGNGDGTFLAPTSFLAGYSALSLATGDFDGDGRDDIASGIYQERSVRVFLNRSAPAVSADTNNDQVPDECGCAADFDGTGFVDTDDFTAFVLAFEAGTNNADFDGSGFVDTDDYDAFVRAFEAGC